MRLGVLHCSVDSNPKNLLHSRGQFGFSGNFVKRASDRPAWLEYDIMLKQCTIRHRHFDYPIRDINGTVHVRGPQFSFEQLNGKNGNATITGTGGFAPDRGLQLRVLAEHLTLDEPLRRALQPSTRAAWDSLRPSGQVDLVRVDLRLPPNVGRPEITIDCDLHRSAVDHVPEAAINPVAFPYEVKRLRGNVRIAGGEIQMTKVEGEHNRTWISCNGTGTYSGTGWNIRLEDMLIGSLRVDEDLLTAMPHTLQTACRSLQFEGLLNVAGTFSLSGEYVEPSFDAHRPHPQHGGMIPFVDLNAKQNPISTSLNWDVRLDMDGAKMHVGMQLENVNGSIRLNGAFDGRQANCQGELNIDSMSLYEMQVTNIQGPIWIDSERVGAGLFARPDNSTVAGQSLTGQLYSGQIQFDAQTWQDKGQQFYLQTTLANAQLKPLARLWAPQMTQLNGLAQGALRLSGDCESRESFRGEGLVQLHNAQLFELPVFLAMFKQLSRPDLDNSAFDSSIAQFTIQGEQISFNRMEFIGDTLSLIGNGSMNGAQEIDFNFFTVMGRNRFYIPVLSELAQASSQQILWIGVDGTMEHPQPHRKILPALNDGLRQLLGTSDSGSGPKWNYQAGQVPLSGSIRR